MIIKKLKHILLIDLVLIKFSFINYLHVYTEYAQSEGFKLLIEVKVSFFFKNGALSYY